MDRLKKSFVRVKLSDLRPYENNPRINDAAAKQVAESIRQTGNIDPIEIDEDNIILSGHTRLKALTELGYTETECIRITGLTEAQKRKYRVLTNKTGEAALWDVDKLVAELEGLDFEGFDFDFDLPDEKDGYFGDARERTYRQVNLSDFDVSRTAGKYEMPVLRACGYVPEKLIGFNYVKSTKETCGVHFFIDDYQFERIWNMPDEVIPRLERFECVLTPDFSLYLDMPIAMQIWNVYRARLIGQKMQDYGLTVIPTLSWSDERSYEFCFDGLTPGGSVAVSTVGVMRDEHAQRLWSDGMTEAIRRLKPETVLCYGKKPEYDFGKIKVKYYDSREFVKA